MLMRNTKNVVDKERIEEIIRRQKDAKKARTFHQNQTNAADYIFKEGAYGRSSENEREPFLETLETHHKETNIQVPNIFQNSEVKRRSITLKEEEKKKQKKEKNLADLVKFPKRLALGKNYDQLYKEDLEKAVPFTLKNSFVELEYLRRKKQMKEEFLKGQTAAMKKGPDKMPHKKKGNKLSSPNTSQPFHTS
mmetsp:Transcript_30088/g.29336  ORF Transcript_30088/g.29336 Transcript_30088/m.29336 type:complete len:193 (+) Transcript_30088:40-618(+)